MVEFIAEIGVNHNGSLETACMLIKACAKTGADIVKFQTYSAVRLEPPGERRDMLAEYELSQKDTIYLSNYARRMGLEFLSTPFSIEDMRFLVDEVGVKRIKIASGFLTDMDFLAAAKETGLPLIISTGMSCPTEVIKARDFLEGCDVIWLHCTSAYPCPDECVFLKEINLMKEFLGAGNVGFSDHSEGIIAAVAAIVMGAVIIEKHVTLDRFQEGPDHFTSIRPGQLELLIDYYRRIETMMDFKPLFVEEEEYALDVLEEREIWRMSLEKT
jgi:sialic acid synthase SpsE